MGEDGDASAEPRPDETRAEDARNAPRRVDEGVQLRTARRIASRLAIERGPFPFDDRFALRKADHPIEIGIAQVRFVGTSVRIDDAISLMGEVDQLAEADDVARAEERERLAAPFAFRDAVETDAAQPIAFRLFDVAPVEFGEGLPLFGQQAGDLLPRRADREGLQHRVEGRRRHAEPFRVEVAEPFDAPHDRRIAPTQQHRPDRVACDALVVGVLRPGGLCRLDAGMADDDPTTRRKRRVLDAEGSELDVGEHPRTREQDDGVIACSAAQAGVPLGGAEELDEITRFVTEAVQGDDGTADRDDERGR